MVRMKRREVEDAQLNLIPIMNLFTGLIPFMLLSAAFMHLSIIRVTVPVASTTGETDIAKEDDKITLKLRVTPSSYDLSASSDTLAPEVVRLLATSVPRMRGDAETEKATYEQLTTAAHRIKGTYASSDTVIVVPDEEIPYEDVVAALDAVRDIVVERDGAKSRVELFPRVVLSSMVR